MDIPFVNEPLLKTLKPDANKTQAIISSYVNRILKQPMDRLSPEDFMKLYTVVYNFLNTGLSSKINYRCLNENLAVWVLRQVEDHIRSLLRISDNLEGDELLSFYTQQWDLYTASIKSLDAPFAPYNNNWLKDSDNPENCFYSINEMCLTTWGKLLWGYYRQYDSKLYKAFMSLEARDLQGETVDKALLERVRASVNVLKLYRVFL